MTQRRRPGSHAAFSCSASARSGPAEMFCDGTHCDRQMAFRERLRASGVTIATVHSADELGLALFQALMTLPTNRLTNHRLQSIPAGRIKFIGREAVLQRIAASLDHGGRVVAVTGMSGVGKTSTVIEYAHRHRTEFDIAWWIRAADPEMVPGALADLARTLTLTTERESDQVGVARLRAFLAGSGPLALGVRRRTRRSYARAVPSRWAGPRAGHVPQSVLARHCLGHRRSSAAGPAGVDHDAAHLDP